MIETDKSPMGNDVMRKIKKSAIVLAVTLCLMIFLVGCDGHHSQREVEEFVADNVPEAATLVDDHVKQTKNGIEYRYTFKSDSRDLEFDVYSSKGTGRVYQLSEEYSLGREKYYLEKMRPLLGACENSRMFETPDKREVSVRLEMDNSSDARAIAGVLAECNAIVTEEWQYQPGADLTDPDVLGLAFKLFTRNSYKSFGKYYLNGLDDEEEVFKKLEAMLVSRK